MVGKGFEYNFIDNIAKRYRLVVFHGFWIFDFWNEGYGIYFIG